MWIKKRFLVFGLSIFVTVGSIFFYTLYKTHLAHTTFDRYYAFRGCVQLVDKTATYGDCKTASGKILRIVSYKGNWYLQGDLPIHW